jgi:hypothetical protein
VPSASAERSANSRVLRVLLSPLVDIDSEA